MFDKYVQYSTPLKMLIVNEHSEPARLEGGHVSPLDYSPDVVEDYMGGDIPSKLRPFPISLIFLLKRLGSGHKHPEEFDGHRSPVRTRSSVQKKIARHGVAASVLHILYSGLGLVSLPVLDFLSL